MHLTGMHRVNEKNLEDLNAAQLKNLMRKGLLARVYLHLLSLENFARLLERKATRIAAAADGAVLAVVRGAYFLVFAPWKPSDNSRFGLR
jgi:hypothetical protein